MVNMNTDGSKEFDVPLMTGTENKSAKKKETHLEELRKLVENMEEDEYAVLVDCIPLRLIMDRIEREIKKKMDIEERINRMYKEFIEKR